MKANNAAKMREALTRVKKMAASYINCHDDEIDRVMTDIVATCDSALSVPLRNCEVGTEEEQSQRFEAFCSLHHLPKGPGCYSCPAIPPKSPQAFHRDACRSNWSQMPYEEGGAK